MPRSVGIIFELRRCHARPGESLRVAGSCAELGAWGRSDACDLELRTSVVVYPLWMMLSPVWVEVPEDKEEVWLEYKYVKDLGPWEQSGKGTVWEECIDNRRVRVPCQAGVWVLSDAAWESSKASELRLTLEGDVARRRSLLDPDPLPITSMHALKNYPVAHRGAASEVFLMTPHAGMSPPSHHNFAIEADYAGLDFVNITHSSASASQEAPPPAASSRDPFVWTPEAAEALFLERKALATAEEARRAGSAAAVEQRAAHQRAVNPEVAGSEEDEIMQLRRENHELRQLVRALTPRGRAPGDSMDSLRDALLQEGEVPAGPRVAAPVEETELMRVLSQRRAAIEAAMGWLEGDGPAAEEPPA